MKTQVSFHHRENISDHASPPCPYKTNRGRGTMSDLWLPGRRGVDFLFRGNARSAISIAHEAQ
jgi:hypothetical protein